MLELDDTLDAMRPANHRIPQDHLHLPHRPSSSSPPSTPRHLAMTPWLRPGGHPGALHVLDQTQLHSLRYCLLFDSVDPFGVSISSPSPALMGR